MLLNLCSLANKAQGKTPQLWRKRPSRASSPTKMAPSVAKSYSMAFKTPTAIGKSKIGPSFLRSAGAKLTKITLCQGKLMPELRIPDLNRSLASFSEGSGKTKKLKRG